MYLIGLYYCAQFEYKLKHVTSNSNFKRKFGKEGKKGVQHHMHLQGKNRRETQ